MTTESENLKKYLLGNLAEAEIERLDLQIIADESYEEKLLLAETELVEDYLEKSLSDEEKRLFFENFLISEERRRLLEETAALKMLATREFAVVETSSETASGDFFRNIKDFFSVKLRPAIVLSSVLLAALATLAAWQIFSGNSLTPLEKEYAALNEKEFSNLAEFSNLSTVTLISGTFRDGGAAAKTKAENLSDSVFFRLAIPFAAGANAVFKAEILKDERKIFTLENARVYRNAGGSEVRMLLPKAVLTKGQYRINLENAANENEKIGFSFSVE
jgi:hypothetical protein